METKPERFEDVAFRYRFGRVEVGGGAGDAPGTVEASGGQPSLPAPPLERASRDGPEDGELTQPRRFELGVETGLPGQLSLPCLHYAPSDAF